MLQKVIFKLANIFLIKQINRKNNCKISLNSNIDKLSTFEGRNMVQGKTSINQSEVGFATYISPDCIFAKTKIGKYCSIGPSVKVVGGSHPTSDYVSTHPIFYTNRNFAGLRFKNNNAFSEYTYTDNKEKYLCEIGSDVWIGQDVLLINGIKIGNGAIITAGAVVTADVPSYAIVGGIPAKVIKYRFNQEEIKFMNSIKWWNESESWIKNHIMFFHDVKQLIATILNEKNN